MNIEAINALSPATKAGGIPAWLEIEGKGNLTFLYNPESKSYSKEASYAAANAGGTGIQEQNYINSTGKTLSLSNLLLDSYCAGRSLRPYLDTLESLLLPKAPGLAPPTVAFLWGSDRFSPAVVTSLSWEETAWLSGEPAMARVSMALLQLPEADSLATIAVTPEPTGEVGLTDRQRADAVAQAKAYLDSNTSKLKPEIKSAYSSSRFKWLTTTAGTVQITDVSGKVLGTVGVWDGFEFKGSEELFK